MSLFSGFKDIVTNPIRSASGLFTAGLTEFPGLIKGAYNSGKARSQVPDYNFGDAAFNLGPASQAGRTTLGNQDAEFRQGQTGLSELLRKRAFGEVPTASSQIIANAQDQNLRGGLALAASGRGYNPGAQRNASNAYANSGQSLAGQGAALGLQEQNDAANSYGSFLAGARGQDIAKEQAQAQLDQAIQLFNTGQINEFQLQQLKAKIDQQQLQSDYNLRKGAIDTGVQNSNAGFNRQLIGGAISGISSGAAKLASGGIGGGGGAGAGGGSGEFISGSAGNSARLF